MNVHPVEVGGREKEEVLLPGYDSVEVLVVVLVEGGLGAMVADPKVDSFRQAPQSLRGPGDVALYIWGEGRVLGPEAVVLLLSIGYKRRGAAAAAAIRDVLKGEGEGHALHVSRGEAEMGISRRRRRRRRTLEVVVVIIIITITITIIIVEGDEGYNGVGSTVWSEVDGDG